MTIQDLHDINPASEIIESKEFSEALDAKFNPQYLTPAFGGIMVTLSNDEGDAWVRSWRQFMEGEEDFFMVLSIDPFEFDGVAYQIVRYTCD